MLEIIDYLYNKFLEHKRRVVIFFVALAFLVLVLFSQVFAFRSGNSELQVYFLDVGQGDSELVILLGGVKVLIDGGPPNGKILSVLGDILPPGDRYIDLLVLSHAQLDHFGGFIEVVKNYRVGAFVWNGVPGESKAFAELMEAVADTGTRVVALTEGDRIMHSGSVFDILSPDNEFLKSKELNNTTLVMRLFSASTTALFTGDIGFEVERALLNLKSQILKADILKVPHHGSQYSSSASFLDALQPLIAVIEVGKNSYGHPTRDALQRLKGTGANIFRTDRDGTVKLVSNGDRLRVFKFNN